jgi:hypothetical protein
MTRQLKMLMPALFLGLGLSATGQEESPIIGLMNKSAQNWNSANLDRFMDLYDSKNCCMTIRDSTCSRRHLPGQGDDPDRHRR